MATFFQSFRSSSMPKRLLRYALSRLELLDADALDMENLDLALGRNTVFEFRDVGIKLKKLENLLHLPATFSLEKAKVLLLRVTIPMDFYNSPIIVEVDGVDIGLKVLGTERKPSRTSGAMTPDEGDVVPNTADLAQSFLQTESLAERRKLESALAAETQDLGASVAMSDDGSEDDLAFGTGEPLSLPSFLADFLQGIVDRMQIKIKGVTFQLDLEVPIDTTSTHPEPVSFQVTLDGVNIEGVTSQAELDGASPSIVPKEGKRHISLSQVGAYLITEPNVFSVLSRSPSMTSPSVTLEPAVTRNQSTTESVPSSPSTPQNRSVASLPKQATPPESFLLASEIPTQLEQALEVSEDALEIPYEFSEPPEDDEHESPATPRASMYHDFTNSPEEPIFHSTMLPTEHISHSAALEGTMPQWASFEREARSEPTLEYPYRTVDGGLYAFETLNDRSDPPAARLEPSLEDSTDDLTRSHVYTHEQAESMYLSAFTDNDEPSPTTSSHATISPGRPASPEPSPGPSPGISPAASQTLTESIYIPQDTIEDQTQPEPENETQFGPQIQSELSKSVLKSREAMPEPKSPSPPPRQSTPPSTEPQPVMPGGWDAEYDESPEVSQVISPQRGIPRSGQKADGEDEASDSGSSSPAFSRASLAAPANEASNNDYSGQQDDAPTPKGPTRLVKEILKLENISIYVPSQHQHLHAQPTTTESSLHLSRSLNRSIYPQAPGAFSVYGGASSQRIPPTSGPVPPSVEMDNALEVNLSPIGIHVDASLGFLLAMVVGKLLEALKSETAQTTQTRQTSHQSKHKKEEKHKTPQVKVLFQEISLSLLNRLSGVADTPERYLDPAAFICEEEVLLNATLGHLSISMSPTVIVPSRSSRDQGERQEGIVTKIDAQKFRFGYANDNIISFDPDRLLSTSIRDSFLPSGTDITVKVIQSGSSVKTEIETLPLVFQLDLQRLDETFSWFGGLSSFINMSASMAPGSPPAAKPTPTPQPKARGVRFDTPIDPGDVSAASENKINMRIGGARVELVGKECSFGAESSAVKLVSREEGIGIACSRLRVQGPYLKNSASDAPIGVEVGGVRLDFLTAPQDTDLERLLELIIPSKVKFDGGNDEIMVDTLLRQRRKGSVLRAAVETVNIRVQNMGQLSVLPSLAEDLTKLSTVAKYLPEDDRPGLMTLGSIGKVGLSLEFGGKIGHFGAEIQDLQVGHITLPSLVAVAVHGISIKRNQTDELVNSIAYDAETVPSQGPVIMARIIGDEMEPVIKLKLKDMNIEYKVPTIMDFLDLGDDATPQDFEASLAASVADLGDRAHSALARPPQSPTEKPKGKPTTLDIGFSDCLLGLNPLGLPSKLVIALTDAHLEVVLPKDEQTSATFGINKASILLIDDVAEAAVASTSSSRRRASSTISRPVADLSTRGFVDICYISAAKLVINVAQGIDGEKQINVDLRDDLLVLETCADSTQTLIALSNALKPPTPPSKEDKFRTNVMPVQDLLASISAEAFGKSEGEYDFDQDFSGAQELAGSGSDVSCLAESPLQVESQYYQQEPVADELFDATSSSILSHGTTMRDTNEGVLLTGFAASQNQSIADSDELSVHEDYYGDNSQYNTTAKVWNSNKNTYDQAPDRLIKHSPLKVSVRDVHVIWNLFDGYDWNHTRNIITKAVQDVESKAYERQARGSSAHVYEEELEDEEAIGDFLFNSIYIGIPANRDPQELSRAINMGLNDNATETESVVTTAYTTSTNRTARLNQPRSKRLKLKRSKHHKITFELQGVNVDMIMYPDDTGETMSSINVKVKNLDAFDHVPTSTWKKFATYDRDMGEREMDTSMVHLELLNVKPIPELAASEIVLRVTILPLRLHVDQDALDFITRFFEFKDDQVPTHASPSDVPFIQRAEVNNVPVKLDFKPKRVDYAGLRSGHTTEFMNFIVLEESRLVLRHIIIYGVSGFDRLGMTLNDIWTPDVKANQLPSVLAGLAPVRSLVNVGSGFKDLIEIPVREYKKDGRVIRSISKGAAAFARTTGTELVKLGAKLAVGTQYALQGAEDMLTKQGQAEGSWEDDDLDEDDKKQISLYADQPTGVISGIRGGYRSLTRDVNLARDAIIAVPGEVMESRTAGGVARAVLKRAPTIIFRPAVGVTKAIGQTLLGATNSIDPHNRRRIEEKYKKH